jgi:hypothetical protein
MGRGQGRKVTGGARMNPYYNIDQRRSWARIQSIAKYDPAAGLRMAAAFGRRLAERDIRREKSAKINAR